MVGDRPVKCKTCGQTVEETFTKEQIEHSIKSFLDYGEEQFGKSQQGYFSGGGFAARCLRYHLTQLKAHKC